MEDFLSFYARLDALNERYDTEFVADHILPLRGKEIRGLHVPENLQILTRTANANKGNKFNGLEK